MRAVRVRAFGAPDQLEVCAVPDALPGAGEILVQVRACALNYSDVLQRAGAYLGGPQPPFIAGSEAAGTVLDAPPGAGPAVGRRVMLLVSGGAQAELVTVGPGQCMPMPEGLSFPDAASFLVPFLTAYHCLTTVGRCQAGEVVIVHAAAGGLGSALVQVARALGLRVLAAASTEAKRDHAKELGAEEVSDYAGVASAAGRMTDRRGVDLVVDGVGGDAFRNSMRALSPFGRAVIVGCSSGDPQRFDATRLVFRSHTVSGFHLADMLKRPDELRRSLAGLLAWLDEGKVATRAEHVLPLADIAAAHRLLESRERIGRVVVAT